VKEFEEMLRTLLADRLGEVGDQKAIIQRLLDLSDINRDTKVSSWEAQGIF